MFGKLRVILPSIGKMRFGRGGRRKLACGGRRGGSKTFYAMNASLPFSPVSALSRVLSRLDDLASARGGVPDRYAVPGRWLAPGGPPAPRAVEPADFFRRAIRAILDSPASPLPQSPSGDGGWTARAVVYDLFVRLFSAFDHDGDGRVSPRPLASGWRETGTFLKTIPLLPHLKRLGVNTLRLLPVTAIGRDGNKGDMGSPYAIRDPYALDTALAEPALGLGPEEEAAAFVEAAHRLGFRVVWEFVFRTSAKDAVWAKEHPEWFYWIRSSVPDRKSGAEPTEDTYGAPLFSPDELKRIYDDVGNGRFGDLLPPHAAYRAMFLPPPDPATVRLVDGRWRGESVDPATGEAVEVRVPGAFCDWGPDSTQPPWTDVTYLKMYDHPDFDYIAYNTVRMYDTRLARGENAVRPLWDKILGIAPYWRRRCGIDGIMLDMGHALPGELKRELVETCRGISPDFSFWEEEFNVSEALREEGCNLCIGPFMQMARHPDYLHDWFKWLEGAGVPVPFMAMAECHDTPRAVHWPGGKAYAYFAQTLGAFVPGGVPYVHGGIELAETKPINTGYDFTLEEQAALPADVLPLFSASALGWTREETLIGELAAMHAAREKVLDVVADARPGSLKVVETGEPAVLAFTRQHPGEAPRLLVLANADMHSAHPRPALPDGAESRDAITGAPVPEILPPAFIAVLPFGIAN